jgi:hypothetical protein
MRTIAFVGLLLSFLLTSCFTKAEVASDKMDATLRRIFSYARSHDTNALENLMDEIEWKNNRTLSNAFTLALYISAPEKYEAQFIERFPTDYAGIMYDFYDQIEIKNLTPHFMYSVEAVGNLAQKGNEKAINRLLRGSIHSDGAVAEMFCEQVQRTLCSQTITTVRVLSGIEEDTRKKLYWLCLEDMEMKEFSALRDKLMKLRPTATEKEATVIQEITKIDTTQMWRGRQQ